MAVKIRLRRQGRRNHPCYRLVVADSRMPRDGKYIEAIGIYNPIIDTGDLHLSVKEDRLQHWLGEGAILSEKAEHLVAKAAPAVLKAHKEARQAKRVKLAAKRRASKEKK